MSERINNYELEEDPSRKKEKAMDSVKISNINTGFIEIPGQISLNIYVQGCKFNCKGCQNPDLIPFEGGLKVTEEDIKQILETKKLAHWICWLGGDATFQPEGFKAFNKIFKSSNRSVCLYTGQKINDIKHLLDNVDLVIDGQWEGIPVTEDNTNQHVYLRIRNNWNKVTFKGLKDLLIHGGY